MHLFFLRFHFMVCYFILTDDNKSPTEVSVSEGCYRKDKVLVQKPAVKLLTYFNHQERNGQQQ